MRNINTCAFKVINCALITHVNTHTRKGKVAIIRVSSDRRKVRLKQFQGIYRHRKRITIGYRKRFFNEMSSEDNAALTIIW